MNKTEHSMEKGDAMAEQRMSAGIRQAKETMEYDYDLLVIGGGPAGYTAALEAAGKGMKTALAESREIGGTCLNRGCIPTKTLLHSAELFAGIKSGATFGIRAKEIICDMTALQARKNEVITQLRSGVETLLKKGKIDVFQGKAQIMGSHEVCISGGASGDRLLHPAKILIATGSRPALPPIPGTDLENVVTSDELLARTELYSRLTIIGGGVIGMEFASIYSAFGCQVTVIEFLDRILANMEKEISQNLKMILKKRGVEIHTGAQVQEICRDPAGSLICRYTEKGAEQMVCSDGVLVATGRKANTEGLFAKGLNIAMSRGRVLVNEYGKTSIPDIYAAGDVTPGIQLAHAASAQAVNAVAHMQYAAEALRAGHTQPEGDTSGLGAKSENEIFSVSDVQSGNGAPSASGVESGNGIGGREFVPPIRADIIPGCVYTDPEIGCVGLTQEEAKLKGLAVTVKKYPMSANGKTVLSAQERGFLKVIADVDSHVILGAQMMCARATDMISEFGTAIVNGLTLEQMAAVVRPHPTFSEAISEVTRL